MSLNRDVIRTRKVIYIAVLVLILLIDIWASPTLWFGYSLSLERTTFVPESALSAAFWSTIVFYLSGVIASLLITGLFASIARDRMLLFRDRRAFHLATVAVVILVAVLLGAGAFVALNNAAQLVLFVNPIVWIVAGILSVIINLMF